MRSLLFGLILLSSLTFVPMVSADRSLLAMKVKTAPTIDGLATEEIWQQAKSITVHDVVAEIDIHLKAAYDNDSLYLLVEFPDTDENRLHRAMVWNPQLSTYENGPSREDCFVFKWSMSGYESKLTLKEDRPYRADIWYWKAHRTDHAGYADDKMHLYTSTRNKKAKLQLSESGKVFYLQRIGDMGEPAYKPKLQMPYTESTVPKYNLVVPTGSRADVRAKGDWQDGRWRIEFARALHTGNEDDLQMELDGTYRFVISRYEISGREPDPTSDIPLYGSGQASEIIVLSFQP